MGHLREFIAIDYSRSDHHKRKDFDTLQEAQDHISAFPEMFPEGVAAANPGGDEKFWVVDSVAKTISQDAATAAAFSAMHIWTRDMQATDGEMPRSTEDIYDALDEDAQGRVVQIMRDRITAKKTLRGERP